MTTFSSLRLMTVLAVAAGFGAHSQVSANERITEQAPPWLQAQAPQPPMPMMQPQMYRATQPQAPMMPRVYRAAQRQPAAVRTITPSAAVNATLTAAQKGHPRAQYDLALMYQNGQGVNVDLEQSTYWLTQAARNGEPEAEYLLAQFYYDGTLGNPDIPQALHWATEASKRGHVEAQYWLGSLYLSSEGVPADIKQGAYWLKQAAQRGSQEAQLALQELARPAPQQVAQADYAAPTQAPDYPPAASPMPARRAAPNADIQRQIQTQAEASSATMRVSLNGMNPNDILELANTGDRYAQFLIGALYEEGTSGFTQNYREAARWYRRAARQNYPKAQYNLALLYEDGRGVEQDYKQAGQWYAEAAKGGFTKAKNNLGILYVLGKGVRKNQKTAEQLFSQAAQEGDQDAAYNLSRLGKS